MLSNQINARGFHVDRKFAEAARKIAKAAAPEINAEIGHITDGAVTGIAQIARLVTMAAGTGLHGDEARSQDNREVARERRACGASASRSGTSARRRTGRRQETRCPVGARRRRRSRPWRLPLSRRIDRALGR